MNGWMDRQGGQIGWMDGQTDKQDRWMDGQIGWMDKQVDEYMVEHYSVFKKMEILPFATTWMKFKDVMLTDQTQKVTV